MTLLQYDKNSDKNKNIKLMTLLNEVEPLG